MDARQLVVIIRKYTGNVATKRYKNEMLKCFIFPSSSLVAITVVVVVASYATVVRHLNAFWKNMAELLFACVRIVTE